MARAETRPSPPVVPSSCMALSVTPGLPHGLLPQFRIAFPTAAGTLAGWTRRFASSLPLPLLLSCLPVARVSSCCCGAEFGAFARSAMAALGAGRRGLHVGTNAAKQQLKPQEGVPATQRRSSLLDRILGSPKPYEQPPLSEPLPNAQAPAFKAPSEPYNAQVTRLSNGAAIASEDSDSSVLSVAVYMDVGAKNERPENAGASHLLERTAFRSTSNRTHFRMTREIEAMGAHVSATCARDCMAYTLETVRSNLPEAVELLADSVLNSNYYEWEVEEATRGMDKELQATRTDRDQMLNELLHGTAFEGGYGRPLLCHPANLPRLTGASLRNFVSNNFSANRLVLSASGCKHEDLVNVASPLLSNVNSKPSEEPEETRYTGGSITNKEDDEEVHLALAFNTPGWMDVKRSTALTVLQLLMGGGQSFSSGGPGKGTHSRLFRRVLAEKEWVSSCNAYASVFNATGILGITAACPGERGHHMVDTMCHELESIANGDFSEKELQRAKTATIATIRYNLEVPSIRTEDIARQVMTFGERYPMEHFIGIINNLSRKELVDELQAVLKTKPTLVAHGNTRSIPTYDRVAQRFH